MSRTPEAKVKARVRLILDGLRANGVPLYYFFPAANGYGRAGIPDVIVCIRGCFVAIECKAGKNTLTPLQERERTAILNAEGGWYLVDELSVEYLRAALEGM